ncbi:TetR/AcrR family transcriptional regulator [Rhodoferax aquaticus]|uniref:TetR/AcrR family transcriptional regulator n=1 Tax=Rhodoferax aquaticus TaxID=2527691 RepID=A0A515EST7_9BURK|nr:TetR/AcrR family transcriptional regulator [Rhodoferax aquaticus]QDL55721.1 TetR/AcrR family transcriptional regulator [Rhodoferax aquaticus]
MSTTRHMPPNPPLLVASLGADAGAETPRSYHHGDLRNALQQSALVLLRDKGLEGLSLREISKVAGVSHAAAYRHYADKQALLADLSIVGFEQLTQMVEHALASTLGGPLAQLLATGRAYVVFGARQPQLLQLMFSNAIPDWQAFPELASVGQALTQSLQHTIAQGQQCGEIRAGDLASLSMAAWSMVHGLAMLLAGKRIPGALPDEAYVQQAAEQCVNVLAKGLRPDPERPA